MQPPFVRHLAELLDRLSEAGFVAIVESNEVSISGLTAEHAVEILDLVGGVWRNSIEDSAGGVTTADQLVAAFQPFRLVLEKPAIEEGRWRLLTLAGFRQALNKPDLPGVVELARCQTAFDTQAFRAVAWGNGGVAVAVNEELRSPRDLVKETGQARIVPADLRRWLLASQPPVLEDAVFATWATLASVNIVRSLVSEVAQDGKLILRGVMRLQIDAPDNGTYGNLGREGFMTLQQATQWVYANSREAETRLGLFVNEMTRSAAHNVSCADGFRSTADALEGARLAFQLGLEGLSKDTMKALSDLRKSLSDETAKLSDITRQLALAVAGSVFLGMGVILTKQTSSISFIGIILFGLVLAIYVAFVGLSGHQYISLQRDLRAEWRRVLYRFISDPEYKRMVEIPAEKAEGNFYDACYAGGLAIFLLLLAMIFIFS
jgi:hypothetical protein